MFNLVALKDTIFHDYFEPDTTGVFLLAPEDAEAFWVECFETERHSYFLFPDDVWFVQEPYELLGRWAEPHRASLEGDGSHVPLPNWDPSSTVHFCISSSTVFQISFKTFRDNVLSFLCVHDDCPIVVDESLTEALWFTALGEVRLTARSNTQPS